MDTASENDCAARPGSEPEPGAPPELQELWASVHKAWDDAQQSRRWRQRIMIAMFPLMALVPIAIGMIFVEVIGIDSRFLGLGQLVFPAGLVLWSAVLLKNPARKGRQLVCRRCDYPVPLDREPGVCAECGANLACAGAIAEGVVKRGKLWARLWVGWIFAFGYSAWIIYSVSNP